MLPVAQNQALHSLLGPIYGGDGIRSFALPDLRGRAPLGSNANFFVGQRGGEESHTLSLAEMPSHNHAMLVDGVSTTAISCWPSANAVLGRSSGIAVPSNHPFSALLYNSGSANTTLSGQALGNTGNGQPHENRMPSLALSFCIRVSGGAYPSRG
jgi:microcystin-dependent protein